MVSARWQWQNWAVNLGSILICLLLLPSRLPGMELLGLTPNWPLIWVTIWSLKRSPLQGVVAGVCLGLMQDAMTGRYPSHIFGLAVVGYLTARLQKPRYLKEDFISVSLVVFVMAVIAEAAIALEVGVRDILTWREIGHSFPTIVLASAILTSLWAPILYFPLNRWWEREKVH
jgi:rod shape-determining protein MreD